MKEKKKIFWIIGLSLILLTICIIGIIVIKNIYMKDKYIDEDGKEVIPKEPNSYKFEAFIFDAFELFDDIAILRGKREDDFAPVKNKDGVDSPKTAKELYERFWNK